MISFQSINTRTTSHHQWRVALISCAANFLLSASILRPCDAFLCFPSFPNFHSYTTPRHHSTTLVKSRDSLSDALEEFSSQFQDMTVSEIQTQLVQYGVEFQQQQQQQQQLQDGKNESTIRKNQSSWQKVPGCVANVHVRTILEVPSRSSQSPPKIQFEGTADALLSRGLLAILTSVLKQASTPNEILQLSPHEIATQLGLAKALSPGRNDGVASMTRVLQQQLQELMDEKMNDCNDKEMPLFVDDTKDVNQQPQILRDDKTTTITGSQRELLSDNTKVNNDSNNKKKRVALLLSGGVDSSVSLHLLLQEGYDVTAFYLKIWLEDELAHLGECPWEDDYQVCQAVCQQAGVPLETLSLQQDYHQRVISYTVQEAQRGRTPNPDILCNSRIKFGCFYDCIVDRGFDYVATGHYARLERDNDNNHDDNKNKDNDSHHHQKVRLFRAPDPVKDQSYFLCALTQDQLRRVIFPIGHLEKRQVRALADNLQLPNRHRADSQGLCFLGKVKFEEFLGAYLGERPGDIVDAATGDILGRHRGVWFHTVGQRKGIGKVLYPLATSRGPWYVVAKDPAKDIVYCSNQYDEDIFTAARSEFHVEDIQWVAGSAPFSGETRRFDMKIRHGPRLVAGTLTLLENNNMHNNDDNKNNSNEGTVKLDHKDGGLAPGQYVVFYEGEECLGGGVISERHWASFLLDHQQQQQQNQSEQASTMNNATVPAA